MADRIAQLLVRKLQEIPNTADAEAKRNVLKEELQFYVLDFIYHHSEYSRWVMYGGSALRICHGLDRMSVDLDFEIDAVVNDAYLDILKTELEKHFSNTYGVADGFLKIKQNGGRGVKLIFDLGDTTLLGHASSQVHVKIDLNKFTAPKTVTERIPIQHDQLSFVILTYNMSALMASKIAAIFLRGTRGVGAALYEEKGRDIYDLLWYMNKKIVPDFDYLTAKNVSAADPRTLFDKLTFQMNKVSNTNLKDDLSPLFLDQRYINNWLENWLNTYLHLVEGYKIRTVIRIARIRVFQNFRTNSFYFTYEYDTEEGTPVRVTCILSEYWIIFGEGALPLETDPSLMRITEFKANGTSSNPASEAKLMQYATLFLRKIEKYWEKTNRIMLGDDLVTKVIRMTADNLKQNDEIVLTKSALLRCELDDLLK